MPRFLRRAADEGLALAQYNLGISLRDGQGVAQNPSEAAMWLGKAADQGYTKAQSQLAVMLLAGNGVPANSRRS